VKLPPLKPGEYHWHKKGHGIFARGRKSTKPRWGCSYTLPAHVAQKYGVARRRRELAAFTIGSARALLHDRKTKIYNRDFSFLERPPEAIPTVRQFAARCIEHAKATKKSWRFDEERLAPFVARYGNRSLDAILPATIDEYKAARSLEVSPTTVNLDLRVVKATFAQAIRWGLIARNPADGTRRMREPKKPIRVLSPEEERKLLAASPQHLRDFIVLILHTGLRRGEALALCKRDVDLDRRMLTVVAGKGDKTRTLPLNDTTVGLLRRRINDPTSNVRKDGAKVTPHDHVFWWNGEPIASVKSAWTKALRASGIPSIKIHGLRDTFATRAVHLGVDLVTLKDLLGHETIQMTVRYAHPTPEHSRQAVELLDRTYGRP